MHKIQNTFIGGLDFIASDTQISDEGYHYLINARQRLGYVEPNNKPLQINTIPAGKKQGIIAIGNILIAFVAGKAYYNVDETSAWIKISGFSMDATVDRYNSIAVPEGKVNYIRALNTDGNINSPLRKFYDTSIDGTPAGILVQDGINQPWIIQYDPVTQLFSSRVTQNYTQWQNDASHREYVPIGKQMMIVDSKLYIVDPTNHFIFQSISGRYFDFMLNVDVNGNKLVAESQGGATSTSFTFDSDEITAITPTAVPSSFIYATARNTRIITLDYSRTIFGEPTYFVSTILEFGVVNQESIVDILGDFAVIDFEGVKSFDDVKQLKFEGVNSIFSLELSRLLKNKKQSNCRTIGFNNYALFDLDTTWGRLLAVYDTLLQKWVALDITAVYATKQFAIVETSSTSKLYAINTRDELFQLYASDEKEFDQLYTKSFTATSEDQQIYSQKGEYLKLYFIDGSVNTNVTVTELVDGQFSQRITQELPENLAGLQFPFQFPIIFSSKPSCEPITYNTAKNGLKGYKIAYIIQWNSDAKLQTLELQTSDEIPVVAKKQVERILNA